MTRLQVLQNGGKALFGGKPTSLSSVLKEVYSEYPWKMESFIRARPPSGKVWGSLRFQKGFLDGIAPQLGINQVRDDGCE